MKNEEDREKEKPLEPGNRGNDAQSTKILLLGLLVLKQTAIVLLARYLRSCIPSHELYDPTHLILLTKATKFALNTALEFRKGEGKSAFTNISTAPGDALKLGGPACHYSTADYQEIGANLLQCLASWELFQPNLVHELNTYILGIIFM